MRAKYGGTSGREYRTCFGCGKRGHLLADCPDAKENEEKVMLADDEELAFACLETTIHEEDENGIECNGNTSNGDEGIIDEKEKNENGNNEDIEESFENDNDEDIASNLLDMIGSIQDFKENLNEKRNEEKEEIRITVHLLTGKTYVTYVEKKKRSTI